VAGVLRVLLAAAAAAVVTGTAAGASPSTGAALRVYSTPATSPLRTALVDPIFSGPQQDAAFRMARASGATYVRLMTSWRSIAPAVPAPDFVASQPDSPGYSWAALDTTVEAAEAEGLTPVLEIVGPPNWALAAPVHKGNAGTPRSKALGEFASALAAHYDGQSDAPPVHVFEVWNEPNLSLDLSPVSASSYRSMVNAVADSVHAVNRGNLVVAGGLDPFNNKTNAWYAEAPLAYMRALLCISNGPHPHATCHDPVHFDAWSHHPYTFGGPFGHANRPDDVSLGDLPRMRSLLQAGVRMHHVVSIHPVQFWVTEFGWDSSPPRPDAAPMALAARWTAESLYQMWRSGITLASWNELLDEKSPSPYQSGLYFYAESLGHARAKPMRTAFRFPFVAYLGAGTVSVWGRDATSAKALVTVERRSGTRGGWRPVATIRTNRYGIFSARLRLQATAEDWLRAVAPDSGTSLAFSLTRPSANLRYGPFGN
jgi:hypothetical protein